NDVVTEDCECVGTPIIVDPDECVAPTEVTIERLSPTSVAISTNVEVWSMYVDIFNNPPSFNSRTKSHWTKLRNTYINNNVFPERTYYLWFRTNCPNGELSEYTELYTVEPWTVARSSSNPNAIINQGHEQLVIVDVFPNPTSDELNISGVNAQHVRIFDSNGSAIFSG
ncbi:T9SS type A sorting domain-containing protein, partial [Weeksellaceae bacterium KMM 9713]